MIRGKAFYDALRTQAELPKLEVQTLVLGMAHFRYLHFGIAGQILFYGATRGFSLSLHVMEGHEFQIIYSLWQLWTGDEHLYMCLFVIHRSPLVVCPPLSHLDCLPPCY